MRKQPSIRNKIIFSIILTCFLPYFIGIYFIKNVTEDSFHKSTLEYTNQLLRQTAGSVDEIILKNTQNLLFLMINDPRILLVDDSIRSYINLTNNTSLTQPSQQEEAILEFFQSISDSHEMIKMVSLGTEWGAYIEYPNFKPSTSYDPRNRKWYIDAITVDKPVISEPYITQITEELVISIAQRVTLEDNTIGVISITISLEDLMYQINNLHYGSSGSISILSPNNVFINSPLNEDWLLHSLNDIEYEIPIDIDEYNQKSFKGMFENKEHIFSVYISDYSGWKYISTIAEKEVFAPITRLSNFITIAYILILLILIFFAIIFSNYITKPILKIAEDIQKMSTFNFNGYEESNYKKYINQQDEIGEITRALNNLEANFFELRDNMATIETQIKNVRIEDPAPLILELSEKNPFIRISTSINELLKRVYNSIIEIKMQEHYISYLADHDPLTCLPNRRIFQQKLGEAIESNESGAVILLDLDNFKGFNDTLGHLFGDEILKRVAERLLSFSNEEIFVSRFGGDEFLLYYLGSNDDEHLSSLMKLLFLLFQSPFIINGTEIKIHFSSGVAKFPDDSRDITKLLMYADMALFDTKGKGKSNFSLYRSHMSEKIKRSEDIKQILREAITHDGFKILYQPQVDISSGKIIGYEALVRLKYHQISPGEFISVAEENNLIINIGRIITQLVIKQMSIWRSKGLTLRPVSINFSAAQIQDLQFITYLITWLNEYEIDPRLIIIEITENVFLDNRESTISFLNTLRSYGIKIAIDDFGTGFSSLSYLTFLPVDSIKIDSTLSHRFLEKEDTKVMDNLIALAQSLNLKVVAEGIENYEQVKKLIIGRCDAIQGYYFSKPIEAESVELEYDTIYNL
ncbi:EAL domain-containing protein [Alkaliphilus transvaalensis]|uniref:EAL domain-containing protein n=1 Tax=Alkaliphilus transvaalensis TaxID=114628 RepID=UPI000685C5A3|nr:EAL domain-containing protein [Alkaliphilus transvaalensis]